MKTTNKYGIEIGTPATFWCWTDKHPAVVTDVTNSYIFIQEVETSNNLREFPDQEWEVYLDQRLPYRTFKVKMDSATKGHAVGENKGYTVSVGNAYKYQDFQF